MSDLKSRIQAANTEVVRRMTESRPLWIDVRRAGDVVPGLDRAVILHAGPPIPWERMCPPQRHAVCGAAVYEGLAPTVDEAAAMVTEGAIRLAPCHEHRAVG